MSKILVPDYFEQFACKCGTCRHPCCDGWGINVDEHEYFTLLGLACSPKLRHKLDDAFVVCGQPTETAFASIQPNYLEQCPMLDEDGLCLLQKEQGEQILPLVCRVYPRAVKKYGEGLREICMSCSCEETVELLMQRKTPLTLHEVKVPLPFDGLSVYDADPEKDRLRHGVIAAMSDADLPFAERLGMIGCTVTGETLLAEGTRAGALVSIRNLLSLLCGVSKSLREAAEPAQEFLNAPEETDLLARFDEAERHLLGVVPDMEAYAGRIVANHILYEGFPFIPDCESPDTAFAALCTAVALLKFLCVCGMAKNDSRTDLIDLFALANRFVEHSDFYKVCSRLDHPRGMEVFARFAPILRAGAE